MGEFSLFVRRVRQKWRLSEMMTVLLLTATVVLFIHTSDLSAQLESARAQRLQSASAPDAPGRTRENRSPLALKVDTAASSSSSGEVRGPAPLPPAPPTTRSPYADYDFGDLNVTKFAGKETLFFNRVPKVGSQSTMQMLKKLSYKNRFNFHKDHPQKIEYINLKPAKEQQLCSLINVFRPPAVFVKHVCFLDFKRYKLPPPIYFNMVRDPVERIISWYYYVRAPWYFVERKRAFPELELPDPAWLKKDYATCVTSGDPECSYEAGSIRTDYGQLTEFFCGMRDGCAAFNSKLALEKAKENVEKYYAVVGVLEEMNKTLTVLEHYIPRFFSGATQLYNEEKKFTKVNRNTYKPPVAKYVKEIVRKNFTHEMEFYEFCKQRLHKQYMALNLNDNS